MRVSSSGGIRSAPYDLSDRDYIRQARARPFTTIISPMLTHTITRKPIIVVALGVEALGGNYMGTLNAIVHQEVLVPFIENKLAHCRCWYVVKTPYGELLTQQGTPENLPHSGAAPAHGFLVEGGASPAEHREIAYQMAFIAALILCAFNSASVAGWYIIKRRLILPLGQQVSALPMVFPAQVTPRDDVESQLQHINQLGLSYVALSQQLKDTQNNLSKTRHLLMQLSDGQSRLAAATSSELQHSFDAIRSYAGLLEDLIAAQLLNPEHRYYYDDVVEMGENLMRLSQGLQLLHQPAHPRRTKQVPWPLAPMMERCTNQLMPCAERRNIALNLSDNIEATCQTQPAQLEMILLCLLYEAVRCSQDEAELMVDYYCDEHSTMLNIQSSHGRTELVALDTRDFGMLLPSLGQSNQQQKLIEAMQSHANLVLASSLAEAMQATLRLSPYGSHGFCIQPSTPHGAE